VTGFLILVLATGVAPLVAGLWLLKPSPERALPSAGSILLCTLAFNLTFLWQEVWLVLPKALTPGLHPVLFHNNHDWTGTAPNVELLQGTGALATLASGFVFSGALAFARRLSPSWRLFFFWMAFQGLFQPLSQFAVGTLLAGNDVGRALAYLHIAGAAKMLLLGFAVAAMAVSGALLARFHPSGRRGRSFGWQILITGLVAVVLCIPFREPRNIVEVALIPLIVNLMGAGWVVLGSVFTQPEDSPELEVPSLLWPLLALGALLAVFQLVLKPGIAF
jgi:hypothetical protein